jgi:mono/diheme cytochrome c family protein
LWLRFVSRCLAGAAWVSVGVVASLAQAQSAPDGHQVFSSVCSACHQATGKGIAGAFPPLAGHLAEIARQDGGRAYVMGVVLFGLQGQLSVEDATYNGVMPAQQGALSDEQVAAVLTYVATELDDSGGEPVDPFDAAAVAEVRAAPRTPQENYALRQTVLAAAAPAPPPPAAEGEGPPPPIYTDAQAHRAEPLFASKCAECHGENLKGGGMGGGAPLSGVSFRHKWSGKPVGALFDFLRTQMPQDRPGSLTDQQYADLVALILSANDFPSGSGEVVPDSKALQNRYFD